MEKIKINLSKITPQVRKLSEMKNVIYDKNWLKNKGDFDLYYMYRKIDVKNAIVHNITVLLPRMLGEEFMKTKGHYHIGGYQEIYRVLEGKAIFLMQKGNEKKIEDVFAVSAKKGEVVIVPKNYGHVTINPSKRKALKTEDWSSENCKGDYSLFEKLNGACYFFTKKGWIKNKNYKKVPPLRFEKPLKILPKDISFLKKP